MSGQPRHPAGTARGGRFAPTPSPAACRTAYAILDALAPGPADGEVIAERGGRVTLHVRRCPHGSFARWAEAINPRTKRPNCKPCAARTLGSSSS